MAERLVEDTFIVSKVDPDGKKFDKVSRIEAKTEELDMFMKLDVPTELFPMKVGERFSMLLASTLNMDGTPDTGYYTQTDGKTLADDYDYVMHGKLYKISEDGQRAAEVYVSFGGLLMMLKGDPSNVASLELDQKLFLLIRRV